jgi:hypothetical protein
MSDMQTDEQLAASQFDDAKRSIELAEEDVAPEADDNRPALDLEPGDAGPVQEDDDLEDDEPASENDDQ